MQKSKRKIIDFNPEGLQGLHFYMEGLNFPVVLATYSDWEETQVSYFTKNVKAGNFDTEAVCQWCISHQIQYRIVYPISKKAIVKHPYKYYKFLKVKRNLNVSS